MATNKCWYPALLFLSLLLGAELRAQYSAEINVASERVALDLIGFHHFDEQRRWSLFTRNRIHLHYDETDRAGLLSINSLGYNFPSGIGLTFNVIADSQRFYPAIGPQFERVFGRLYFYLLTNLSYYKATNLEQYLMAVYTHRLSSGNALVGHLELYGSWLDRRHDLSLQRLKLGYRHNKLEGGLISETYQSRPEYESVLVNTGVYLKRRF